MSSASPTDYERPSSMPSDDIDSSTSPRSRSESILHAEVVVANGNPNNDIEEHSHQVETLMSQNKNDRDLDRPLFTALCTILLLAFIGLAVSITRYVQVTKNTRPLPPPHDASADKMAAGENSSPVTELQENLDHDPVGYRIDIEYVLSTEIKEEWSMSFWEGAQKMAIDWLVYEDRVLSSAMVRRMVEFIDSNNTDGKDNVATFPLVQRYALMVLFFGTSGDLWTEQHWTEMVDTHECDFLGVDCNSEGQAIVLDLAFRKLRGRLPEEVGMLTNLEFASFLSNSLEGTIPSFVYNKLTNLGYLDLSRNEFSSTISSDISKLTNIKVLNLNELSLTGTIPVDAIKSLSTLEHVAFNHATKMSGPLLEFSNSWPNLISFDIYRTGFTGTIPTTIGMNGKLEQLWLEDVSMDVSKIPTEIGFLTNLDELVIGSLSGVGDGGNIPTELGNCEAMKYLQLEQISGPIPTELGRLTDLVFMSFNAGMITGTVPSEIGYLTNLRFLSLVHNQLRGTLPSELGKLQSLLHLNLYDNMLTGSIPMGICASASIAIERDCSINECQCCYTTCKD